MLGINSEYLKIHYILSLNWDVTKKKVAAPTNVAVCQVEAKQLRNFVEIKGLER